MAIVNNNIGILEYTDRDGDRARSRAALEESLRLHTETKSQRGRAEAYINLGVLAHYSEQWDTAQKDYLESLQLRQMLRHGYGVALVLTNLCEIAEKRLNLIVACRCFAAAEALFLQSQSPYAEYAAEYLLKTAPLAELSIEELRRTAKSLSLDALVAWAIQDLN